MNENKIFGYDVIKIENTDSNFPERLKNITNKPKALYMIGNIGLLNKNEIIAIAITIINFFIISSKSETRYLYEYFL